METTLQFICNTLVTPRAGGEPYKRGEWAAKSADGKDLRDTAGRLIRVRMRYPDCAAAQPHGYRMVVSETGLADRREAVMLDAVVDGRAQVQESRHADGHPTYVRNPELGTVTVQGTVEPELDKEGKALVSAVYGDRSFAYYRLTAKTSPFHMTVSDLVVPVVPQTTAASASAVAGASAESDE